MIRLASGYSARTKYSKIGHLNLVYLGFQTYTRYIFTNAIHIMLRLRQEFDAVRVIPRLLYPMFS